MSVFTLQARGAPGATAQVNGRSTGAKQGVPTLLTRGGRKILSWMDAPDDVFFIATDVTRKLRRQMTSGDFRKAARKPWRSVNARTPATPNSSSNNSAAAPGGGVVVLE